MIGKVFNRAGVIALFLVGSTPATISASQPSRPSAVRIEVHTRFSYSICGGLCINQTLIVTPEGKVDIFSADPFHPRTAWPARHFVVSSSAVAAFQKHLATVRPRHSRDDPSGCRVKWHVRGAWDFDIRWYDRQGLTRLRTCHVPAELWGPAYKALGFPEGPAGRHRPV